MINFSGTVQILFSALYIFVIFNLTNNYFQRYFRKLMIYFQFISQEPGRICFSTFSHFQLPDGRKSAALFAAKFSSWRCPFFLKATQTKLYPMLIPFPLEDKDILHTISPLQRAPRGLSTDSPPPPPGPPSSCSRSYWMPFSIIITYLFVEGTTGPR